MTHSFNPRPHAAGDPDRSRRRCAVAMRFNPRPHAAGDGCDTDVTAEAQVSIHARTRRATPAAALAAKAASMFQSTPARGGRPRSGGDPTRLEVSIHARTRRATIAASARSRPGDMVSIHARTRRATQLAPAMRMVAESFQSTPARGGRRITGRWSGRPTVVSIHARTRRATRGHARQGRG